MSNKTSDTVSDPCHMSSYHLLPRSYQTDLIDDVYQIHTDRPINELGNQFCRYYFATHIGTEKEYFAIVFERGFNVSIKELSILRNSHCPYINNLLSYSLVKLGISKKYSVCAIVEAYNPEENLQHYVETTGVMDDETVENRLIPSISSALSFCDTHKINCGNISPSNIIISKDGVIKLREFFITLPNFFQPPAFIAPEIADALPIARKVFSLEADIYAFGMSVYYALTKAMPDFSRHEPQLFNSARIEAGTYNMTAAQKRIAQKFKLFLAWTLNDIQEDRWTVEDLVQWQALKAKGKMPKPKSPNRYTTLFNGHNYSNPVALVSAMYVAYDDGMKFCRNDTFLKWTQKAKGKLEAIDDIMHNHIQDMSSPHMTDDDLQLTFFEVISLLDPTNICLKLRNCCIALTAIPNITFHAVYSDNAQLIDTLTKIFANNYFGLITNKQANIFLPQEYLDLLSVIATYFSPKNQTRTIEQMLYEIDKYTPCLSPVVSNDYVLSIEDLLVSLDRVAAHTPGKLAIDKHIVAFISSRVELPEDIEEKGQYIETVINSPLLKSMSLLAAAQEHVPDIKIPHLCSVVAQKLIEWVNDNLYNAKLKNVITSELAELAGGGMLSQMLYVVSNSKLFHNDNRGYNAANKQIVDLSKKIKKMSDPVRTYNDGLALGQRLTVLFSYLACMIVAIILIM